MVYATPHSLIFGLSALASLLPATLYALSPRAPTAGVEDARAPRLFWLLGAVAFSGSVAWTVAQFAVGWRTGFAPSLWLIIVVTLALYGGLAAMSAEARRLAAPLFVYLSLMALPAILWSGAPERPLVGPFGMWMTVHILAAILAYAFATLAAVAGVGVLLREAALKRKTPSGASPRLSLGARMPAVADGERLQSRLLMATALLLAIGLMSGMAAQYVETGALLPLTHKVVLAFVAFAVVVALLALHFRLGVGGRRLARVALGAYLVLAFAYPGVKFVTDVLIGGN